MDNPALSSTPKLSLCIPTFNRSSFLQATLEELTHQATTECEIVIANNASTDSTEQVVFSYKRSFDRIRYWKQDVNVGVDRNFDRAVTLARGEFCWLMGDDDILRPGAVARVLSELRSELSLIIVNMQLRDLSMSKVVRRRWITIKSDRLYGPDDIDRFFIDMDYTLWNAGNIVVRRSIWLSRNRECYYGSNFIHTGVIFQERLPGRTLVIATPLVNYRLGNNTRWKPNAPEIFLNRWPSLIDSLALSAPAKAQIRSSKPWKQLQLLLGLRSCGYSLAEYRRWILPRVQSRYEALLPIVVALTPLRLAQVLSKFSAIAHRSYEQLLHSIQRE